jgi:hypothetical protein
MTPEQRAEAERVTGGNFVTDDGRVLVSRPNDLGGWTDLGYADNFELEQADQLRDRIGQLSGALSETLRARKMTMEVDVPFELVQDWARNREWITTPSADWVRRWSSNWLNGPAARLREGWRNGPVRWSWSSVMNLIGTKVTYWGSRRWDAWIEQRHHDIAHGYPVRSTPDPLVQYTDLVAAKQRVWAERWTQVLNAATREDIWESAGYEGTAIP